MRVRFAFQASLTLLLLLLVFQEKEVLHTVIALAVALGLLMSLLNDPIWDEENPEKTDS